MRGNLKRAGKAAVLGALLAGCTLFPATGSGPGVGRPAPETEGPDADGRVFRLSEYRGKVVLLDFWGDF